MPVFKIAADMTIWIDGEPYKVGIVSKDGTVFLESIKRRGEVRQMPYEDVAAEIVKGNAQIKRPANTAKVASIDMRSINAKLKQDIEGLTPAGRKEFERRWAYVQPLNGAQLKRLREKVVKPVIDDVAKRIGDPAPPSYDTVRRWYREFLAGDRDIRALFPSANRRGWRTRRLNDEVISIARQVIIDVYLTPERNSVRQTWDALVTAILEANSRSNRLMELPIPSLRWLYDEINRQFDGYEQDLARKGKITAELNYRAWGRGARPTRPLERVEIDHTVLDLIVVDDEYGNPIGRPTITAAIDVATRMIVGFHISFRPPSIHSVLKCLRHMIMPKKELLAKYPEIKNTWDAFGVPETIVTDNGKEFHSKAMELACAHLNINVHHTPRKQPWQKPKIERLFGILNTEVLAGLPGRTFSNVMAKGDYKSEKTAVISLGALVKIIYIWVVEDYNQTPRQSTLEAPAHAWVQAVKSFPTVPSSMDDLNFALSHVSQRTIQPTGIQMFGLKYQHQELSRLRRQRHGDCSVTVRYDSEDLGSIVVVDPDTGVPIRVPAVEAEYANGLTLSQHIAIRDYLRRTTDKRVLALQLADVRKLVRLIIVLERQKMRKGWTKRMAKFTGVDSDNPDGRAEFLDPVLLEIAGATAQDYRDTDVTEDPDGKAFDDLIEEYDEADDKDETDAS